MLTCSHECVYPPHLACVGEAYFYHAAKDTVTRDHPLDDFYRTLYATYLAAAAEARAAGRHPPERGDPTLRARAHEAAELARRAAAQAQAVGGGAAAQGAAAAEGGQPAAAAVSAQAAVQTIMQMAAAAGGQQQLSKVSEALLPLIRSGMLEQPQTPASPGGQATAAAVAAGQSPGADPAELRRLVEKMDAAAAETSALAAEKARVQAEADAMIAELSARMDTEKAKHRAELERLEQQLAERGAAREQAAAAAAAAAAKAANAEAGMATSVRGRAAELRATLGSLHTDVGQLNLWVFNKLQAVAQASDRAHAKALEDAARISGLEEARLELERGLAPLEAERRRLFNELLRLKGNIRVFARVRPPNPKELKSRDDMAVSFPDGGKAGARRLLRLGGLNSGQTREYEFDRVFSTDEPQEAVFADVAPLVQSVLDGFNVAIFAYGQTGSGKTYTMEGPAGDRGVTYRAFELLFSITEQSRSSYAFRVSVMEVYNEQLRDLLREKQAVDDGDVRGAAEKPSRLKATKHDIKTDDTGCVVVSDMSEVDVESAGDFVALMERASRNRSTGATAMNAHSSRSHLIMMIHVTSHTTVEGRPVAVTSKLSLIDLAGSERQSKTQSQGERLAEAKHINKSLSALGDVISALTSKERHVPYRNSKLTHLLSDSLGPNESKTLLFVNCSPVAGNAHESNCSLQFASRARNVDLSSGGAAGAMVKKWKAAAQQAKRDRERLSAAASNEAAVLKEQAAEAKGLREELARQAAASKAQGSKLQEAAIRSKGAEESRDAALAEAAQERAVCDQVRKQLEAERASNAKDLDALRKQAKELKRELKEATSRPPSQGSSAGEGAAELREQVRLLTDINQQLLDKSKSLKREKRAANERTDAIAAAASAAGVVLPAHLGATTAATPALSVAAVGTAGGKNKALRRARRGGKGSGGGSAAPPLGSRSALLNAVAPPPPPPRPPSSASVSGRSTLARG